MEGDWYRVIAAESVLPPDAARRLRDVGFVVLPPGPEVQGGWARLSLATADDKLDLGLTRLRAALG